MKKCNAKSLARILSEPFVVSLVVIVQFVVVLLFTSLINLSATEYKIALYLTIFSAACWVCIPLKSYKYVHNSASSDYKLSFINMFLIAFFAFLLAVVFLLFMIVE